MAETDPTDEQGATTAPLSKSNESKSGHEEFWRAARRDLSEAELLSPTGLRFLMGDIDRCRSDIEELKDFRERAYEAEKHLAVLQSSQAPLRWNEILSSITLSIGSAGLGFSSLFLGNIIQFSVIVVMSSVLILSSLVLKVGVATRMFGAGK